MSDCYPNLNPATGRKWEILGNDAWREFLGEEIHRDYTVEIDPQTSEVTLTPRTQYAAGLAYQDEGAASPSYTATDHLGAVRRITDPTSAVSQRTIYTAFGERADTSALNTNRYGYAGAHGYEEPIPNLGPLGQSPIS